MSFREVWLNTRDAEPELPGEPPHQGASDHADYAVEHADVAERDFSSGTREAMSKTGTAMPDGSYPIANVQDLKNAIQAFGRAKNPEATKRHIIKRARALGATDLLPEDWSASTKEADIPSGSPDVSPEELQPGTPLDAEFLEAGDEVTLVTKTDAELTGWLLPVEDREFVALYLPSGAEVKLEARKIKEARVPRPLYERLAESRLAERRGDDDDHFYGAWNQGSGGRGLPRSPGQQRAAAGERMGFHPDTGSGAFFGMDIGDEVEVPWVAGGADYRTTKGTVVGFADQGLTVQIKRAEGTIREIHSGDTDVKFEPRIVKKTPYMRSTEDIVRWMEQMPGAESYLNDINMGYPASEVLAQFLQERTRLTEARGDDDHFYGAWHQGSGGRTTAKTPAQQKSAAKQTVLDKHGNPIGVTELKQKTVDKKLPLGKGEAYPNNAKTTELRRGDAVVGYVQQIELPVSGRAWTKGYAAFTAKEERLGRYSNKKEAITAVETQGMPNNALGYGKGSQDDPFGKHFKAAQRVKSKEAEAPVRPKRRRPPGAGRFKVGDQVKLKLRGGGANSFTAKIIAMEDDGLTFGLSTGAQRKVPWHFVVSMRDLTQPMRERAGSDDDHFYGAWNTGSGGRGAPKSEGQKKAAAKGKVTSPARLDKDGVYRPEDQQYIVNEDVKVLAGGRNEWISGKVIRKEPNAKDQYIVKDEHGKERSVGNFQMRKLRSPFEGKKS